jgi:chromosome segregation ATPase
MIYTTCPPKLKCVACKKWWTPGEAPDELIQLRARLEAVERERDKALSTLVKTQDEVAEWRSACTKLEMENVSLHSLATKPCPEKAKRERPKLEELRKCASDAKAMVGRLGHEVGFQHIAMLCDVVADAIEEAGER